MKRKIGYSVRAKKKIYKIIFLLVVYFLGAILLSGIYLSRTKSEKVKTVVSETFGPYSDALASNFIKHKPKPKKS